MSFECKLLKVKSKTIIALIKAILYRVRLKTRLRRVSEPEAIFLHRVTLGLMPSLVVVFRVVEDVVSFAKSSCSGVQQAKSKFETYVKVT